VVQLTHAATNQRIEHELDYARREWESVPEYLAAWTNWDEDERLDFVLEWAIRESSLTLLREWAANGLLSRQQQERYEDLLCTVAKHRPLIGPLLAE
jgi:hypothetical protein